MCKLRWVAWIRTGFGKKCQWGWLWPLFDESWRAEEYVRDFRCTEESATRLVLDEKTMPVATMPLVDFDAEMRKAK